MSFVIGNQDHELAARVIQDLVLRVMEEQLPNEDQSPGIQSLIAHALIDLVAQILSACVDPESRGMALEHHQNALLELTRRYVELRATAALHCGGE